jgi:hypothetical protein
MHHRTQNGQLSHLNIMQAMSTSFHSIGPTSPISSNSACYDPSTKRIYYSKRSHAAIANGLVTHGLVGAVIDGSHASLRSGRILKGEILEINDVPEETNALKVRSIYAVDSFFVFVLLRWAHEHMQRLFSLLHLQSNLNRVMIIIITHLWLCRKMNCSKSNNFSIGSTESNLKHCSEGTQQKVKISTKFPSHQRTIGSEPGWNYENATSRNC